MEYQAAKRTVDMYQEAKQKAMKSFGDNKAAVAKVKDDYSKRSGCEGLVESEKEAFEMFKAFKEDGYYFISTYLGSKTNSSKQIEKSAGLALFGAESNISEFKVMHGAVFCVRDFFKWVQMGRPEPSKDGEEAGGIVNKDELDLNEPHNEEAPMIKDDAESPEDMLDAILANENINLEATEQKLGLNAKAIKLYRKYKAMDGGTGAYEKKLASIYEKLLEQLKSGLKLQNFINSNGGRLAEDKSEFAVAAPHKNKLIGLIQDGVVDAKETALNLAEYISDEDASRYMQIYLDGMESEEKEGEDGSEEMAGLEN